MYRRSGRGRVLLLVFIALSLVIITLDFRQNPGGPLKRARDLAATVVAPVQRGFSAVTRPVGDFFSSLGDLTDLRSKNERLEEDLAEAESDAAALPQIEEDLAVLQEYFELDKSWRQMDRVTAPVIGRAPSNYKWAVEIDRGRSSGIRPDMSVIAPQGLVGKVIRAGSNTATVLLLIDPDGAASATVEGEGNNGTIRGNGGSELLSLEFIRTDADVNVGDTVVTSGQDGGIFPRGINIGSVAEVGGEEADVSKDITVEPFVDFDGLTYVTVLLETGDRIAEDRAESR
nr:rod shape-determining protein MreC [Actinomycetota bacterium]